MLLLMTMLHVVMNRTRQSHVLRFDLLRNDCVSQGSFPVKRKIVDGLEVRGSESRGDWTCITLRLEVGCVGGECYGWQRLSYD